MEEYGRRQRERERERNERQQILSANHENSLFSEPRRVNPSADDDRITAKLGEYSAVREYINNYIVGFTNSGNRQIPSNAILPGIMPTSASTPTLSSGSVVGGGYAGSAVPSTSQQRLSLPPPPPPQQHLPLQHHYPQQSRQPPYLKQDDNKPPYNGRGGYPGQPVKNDLRSSGMAPPRGPPLSSLPSSSTASNATSSSSQSLMMQSTPSTTLMPNGRQSTSEKSFLEPQAIVPPTHNGRFPQPSIPKNRFKLLPPERDVEQILNIMDKFCVPGAPLTQIAATPRTTIVENYNLNGPNKFKYAFDTVGASSVPEPITPLRDPVNTAALAPLPPLLSPPPASAPSNLAVQSTAPTTLTTTSSAITIGQQSSVNLKSVNAATPPPAAAPAAVTTATARPEEASILKAEKITPILQKHNSTLENDLELSESDDDRKKQNHSALNSSESSQSDSSESGSEDSSKGEVQSHNAHHQQQQPQPLLHHSAQHLQQSATMRPSTVTPGSDAAAGVALSAKKKSNSQTITASGGNTISGLLSANVLGSAGSSCSGPSSTSSSNKTPSPSDSNKWNLSNYFKTHPTQNGAAPTATTTMVNSMKVSMNAPTLLPGGAQIIPEPMTVVVPPRSPNTAVVKNEAMVDGDEDEDDDDDDDDDDDSDEEDENDQHSATIATATAGDAFRHPAAAAFGARKTPQGLSVTSMSAPVLEIKKESADSLFSNSTALLKGGVNVVSNTQVPMLNDADFVAIPKSQIKHEASASTIADTKALTITSLRGVHSPKTKASPSVAGDIKNRHCANYPVENFPELSSDSQSSGGGNSPAARRHHRHTQHQQHHRHHNSMPIVNPDGTLLIPGVSAVITALPRSPPMLSKSVLPPNTLTVTPIDPLPASPKNLQQQRAKKPRKKMKTPAQLQPACDSSDEEECTNRGANSSASAAALRGKLQNAPALVESSAGTTQSAATTTAAVKKGRGRPRKNTPNQSGNLSSASASSNTKGPTLTAKKDVSGVAKGNVTTKSAPAKKSAAGRRRISRQNSSSTASSAQDNTPTKPINASNSRTSTAVVMGATSSYKLPEPKNAAVTSIQNENGSSEDSSSSSSSSSGSSSSSSSSSDSEASSDGDEVVRDGSAASSSEESDHKRQSIATSGNTAAGRRIVKQLNKRKTSLDDMPALPKNALTTHTSVTKKGRTAVQIEHTSSSSSDSSTEDYGSHAVSDFAATAATGSGGSSHRSLNQQSPLKATLSNHGILTSCSSSSSDDEQSDVDDGVRKEKKLRRDKPKSDKNKISTLTRIFNPKEGGAKKQGQVVIIDQSEELLAKEQHQLQQQKHISPNAAFKSSQENLAAQFSNAATSSYSSPRLTPGHQHHTKSPRNPTLPPQLGAAVTSGQHRTPDRSRRSDERKVKKRIRTPTRTPPTRTLTPTQQNLQTIASPARGLLALAVGGSAVASPTPRSVMHQAIAQSLICRIDLSRLRVAKEWHMNPYRLYNTSSSSTPTANTHANAGPPATSSGTSNYDHETILNADFQQTTQQMRLKSSSGGSIGNRTPTQPLLNNPHSEREMSRSRETNTTDGVLLGSGGKQRLEDLHGNAARINSRSGDGSSTAKDLHAPLPNGYAQHGLVAAAIAAGDVRVGNASPSTKLMSATGVKHEHIKYEPDLYATHNVTTFCKADTKFKTGSDAEVKQELILKNDYKPSELSDKHMDSAGGITSPLLSEAKQHNKRGSNASSSPYKEKKRKKDKDIAGSGKDKEKDMGMDMRDDKGSGDDMYGNKGQAQKELMLQEQTQLPPTNHDRLLGEKQAPVNVVPMPTPQHNNNKHHMASSNPAHLRNNSNTTAQSMPPPSNAVAIQHQHQQLLLQQQQQQLQRDPNSNANANATALSPSMQPQQQQQPPPPLQQQQQQPNVAPSVVYRSYFERDDYSGDLRHRHQQFIEEAVNRKHAADREQNSFNQVTLYLEAVVYFILSGAAMEQSRNSDSAFKMNKDTLELIKFISKKFPHLQVPLPIINKVHVLSLRCQSLISLKLYKIKRPLCIYISGECNDFFRSGRGDIVNGNTPSSVSSPSNSIGSQGSGSNTPPGKMVPQHIHSCLQQQNEYFGYLTACHDLWDQADRLVQDNLTDFFIALDRENGPLTLHSTTYEVFRYVQAGLKKLKDAMSSTQS